MRCHIRPGDDDDDDGDGLLALAEVFSLLLSLFEKGNARAEGETIFWTFSCIQHLSRRNFPCMLLSICLGESEKEGNLFEIDDDDFNLITLKNLCVYVAEWMSVSRARCLEKLLNTTEIEAWQKKRIFEYSHTRLLGTRTGGERDIRLKENWYAIWCHFCKRFVKRKRFFQRFFNNHLIRVENRGISGWISQFAFCCYLEISSLFYPMEQREWTISTTNKRRKCPIQAFADDLTVTRSSSFSSIFYRLKYR